MSRKRRRNKKQQKRLGFWQSLEEYIYKRIAESRVKWSWVGAAIVILIVGISIANGYFNSSPLFGSTSEVIKTAAEKGDYETAKVLFMEEYKGDGKVEILGAGTELEELVYPERKIEHEIEKEEEMLLKYPGSRDLLINLNGLYKLRGNEEIAEAYWEQARRLDPNNEIFR